MKLRYCGSTVMFMCPGCNEAHAVDIGPGGWGYNHDSNAPTFTPSVLVTSYTATPPVTAENLAEWKREPWEQTKVKSTCHSYITNGQIKFLDDCTHDLRGVTVPLPEWKANA